MNLIILVSSVLQMIDRVTYEDSGRLHWKHSEVCVTNEITPMERGLIDRVWVEVNWTLWRHLEKKDQRKRCQTNKEGDPRVFQDVRGGDDSDYVMLLQPLTNSRLLLRFIVGLFSPLPFFYSELYIEVSCQRSEWKPSTRPFTFATIN